ncbi:hypothetical protein AB0C34_19895 [Nocardia sp. NPDC049220]|uniref:hypothetical protein n=1 Tax=Nocardia sp. NPDC049220 TaxID=3155273 RepID=UPI0033E5FDDD
MTTEPLDMDDPHEVVVASNKYSVALAKVGDQVEQITRDFVVPRRPQAKVEQPLAAFTKWMKTAIESKVKTNGRGADATAQHARTVSTALSHQDHAGGARIRKTEYL